MSSAVKELILFDLHPVDFKFNATSAVEHFFSCITWGGTITCTSACLLFLFVFLYLFFFVLGRILNRFSKDIGMIDDMMPMILCDVLQVSQHTSNIRDVQKRLWILSN